MAAAPDPLREEARRQFAAGKTIAQISRELNRPRTTVACWVKQTPDRGENVHDARFPLNQGDVKDMEIAALRSQLQQAKVTPAYQPNPGSSPEARWKAAELDNAEAIKRALFMAHFSVELPDKPCAISCVSDQHISLGNTVDLARMREDAELIAEHDGCFAILGGDATDNHVKHRAAVLAARSQPSDQFELFEWYLSIFAHRVLVAISGNHDLWTNQVAGVDVLSMLLAKQKVCYAPDEALLDLTVGQQPYKIGIRHQYRMNSSFNETHVVKQWFRNGECSWDIGCIGHHHVSAIEPFWGHGVERWACRPGSYQITSAYSRQFGFNKTRPMCPTFVLYPDRREIVGFHDLRPALRFLKAERG